MAVTVTTKGIASWGIQTAGVQSVCTGIVTSFESSADSVSAPEPNEIGTVIFQTHYDTTYSFTATLTIDAATAMPEIGKAITIDGRAFYVTGCRVTESNTDYRKISVTGSSSLKCTALTDAPGLAG